MLTRRQIHKWRDFRCILHWRRFQFINRESCNKDLTLDSTLKHFVNSKNDFIGLLSKNEKKIIFTLDVRLTLTEKSGVNRWRSEIYLICSDANSLLNGPWASAFFLKITSFVDFLNFYRMKKRQIHEKLEIFLFLLNGPWAPAFFLIKDLLLCRFSPF